MTDPTTRTLEVPGAALTYDLREADAKSEEPLLLMIAWPMDASGFTSLAPYFSDRTVVTYDPRGSARSKPSDEAGQPTPAQHADDLHRLILELDCGPVDIFGSSGGANNGLVLVARHPELVHTLVAHEPPVATVLTDREDVLAAAADVQETYERQGLGPAMAKFIALTSAKGPIPPDFADRPGPDPADFGLPSEDDGTRDDPLLGNMTLGPRYEHDFDALRAASTRIVLAAGAESEGELTHRAALAVAERLGQQAVIFPSHHAGFLGGEFGQTGEPEAFAAMLRQVLAEDD